MGLRLGDILVEKGLIKPEELKEAVRQQQRTGEMLGQILIRMGFVSEKEMLTVLAGQQGIPFVSLKEIIIEKEIIQRVPAKFALHYKIMPIKMRGNVLTIAISNPFDMWPIDDLETHLGFRVEKILATSVDIKEAIEHYYGVGAETIENILLEEPPEEKKPEEEEAEENLEDLEKMAEAASIIKLVNQVLQQAIKDRATDIHIEHFRDDVIFRSRVDGVLYDTKISEKVKYLYPAVISRIKIMTGLNIVERRLPQDGRAKIKIAKDEYELRVSVIPTLYGENIVIRILPTVMLFNLAGLGITEKNSNIMEELLKKAHGIIFVTGPTGSGKSTTLYTFLSRLNTRKRKIITIEDPVEYELRGVSQIQINPQIGLTFAKTLRSVLRHDPDIIMVGEVRDAETAGITIQTALTGHLVFSTLHTNDAASGITRLLDIQIEPFLIASSVEAFIAQRLVRVICPHCKEDYVIGEENFEQIQEFQLKKNLKKTKVFRGKGCKKCNDTGYIGRTGIYEVLIVNKDMKQLIVQKSSTDIIKQKAIEQGMKTLRQDGWEKVLAGITTVEEVLRVTQIEE